MTTIQTKLRATSSILHTLKLSQKGMTVLHKCIHPEEESPR